MSATRRRPAVLGACLALAALAGCGLTQPTKFYTLSTVTEPAKAPVPARGLVIGLGPLTVPPYLDRPDIVTRVGANGMRLGDFSQWAEPLEPQLTRIIADTHGHQRFLGQPLNGQMGAASQLLNATPHLHTAEARPLEGHPDPGRQGRGGLVQAGRTIAAVP